jgi:autotransporter-associated beta strand protein/T5SS/PEP-CTERM-associated repeat protein
VWPWEIPDKGFFTDVWTRQPAGFHFNASFDSIDREAPIGFGSVSHSFLLPLRARSLPAHLAAQQRRLGMRYAGTVAVFLLAAAGSVSPKLAKAQSLIVNSGTTVISSAQSYSSTQVAQAAIDTATLQVTTAGTLSNSSGVVVGIRGTGALNLDGGSLTNTFFATIGQIAGSVGTVTVSSGTWANSGDLFVGSSGTGTLNVTGGLVTNVNSTVGVNGFGTATVSGGTWANSGSLTVGESGTGSISVTGGLVTSVNSTLGFFAGSVGTATVSSGTLANSGNLAVGVSGTGTLDISGSGVVSVGGTLSQGTYGTINLNSGGTLQIGVGGTTGVLGVSTLTNNGTLIFNRSDAPTYSGIISGTGAVRKQGDGTLTLSGSSTYTGATAVDGGTMLVNGQLGDTAVTVNANGLLGGTGTILGGVTVASSGTLSPGNSTGVLTVGSLSLLPGSHTLMEIDTTSLYDQIVGTGTLTYGGSLDLVMTGSYADGTTFNLFRSFSSKNGDFTTVELDATGEYFGLLFTGTAGVWTSTWTTNHQRLVFSTTTGNLVVVPEPSTYAMVIAGLACGGWQMFRRRRLRQTATLAA